MTQTEFGSLASLWGWWTFFEAVWIAVLWRSRARVLGAGGRARRAPRGVEVKRISKVRLESPAKTADWGLAAHRLDTWAIPYGTGPHEEIVLVLGELTANAVRHGHVPGRDFHLLLHVCAPARTARIEVTDTRTERTPPDPAKLHAPGAEATGGRGLLLVAGLATRWGWYIRSDGPGKKVWAECVCATPT